MAPETTWVTLKGAWGAAVGFRERGREMGVEESESHFLLSMQSSPVSQGESDTKILER